MNTCMPHVRYEPLLVIVNYTSPSEIGRQCACVCVCRKEVALSGLTMESCWLYNKECVKPV